eukprot:12085212-Alexandrium_andersonii.AAC.1
MPQCPWHPTEHGGSTRTCGRQSRRRLPVVPSHGRGGGRREDDAESPAGVGHRPHREERGQHR